VEKEAELTDMENIPAHLRITENLRWPYKIKTAMNGIKYTTKEYDPEKVKLILALRKDGLSIKQIAENVGMVYYIVQHILETRRNDEL
jgi:hypothetical protein